MQPEIARSEEITLSVLVPVFNEASHIDRCLASIIQGVDGIRSEVIVIDGMSTDGSVQSIHNLMAAHPEIRLVENVRRKQVYGLNLGLNAARGKYIVRCDAHSTYPVGYFRNFIEFYERSDDAYGNVGVTYETRNEAVGIRSGIAEAMQTSFGIGGSHRVRQEISTPRSVDTVLFGAWPASIFREVGQFDEAYIRGQDYEHNMRIRRSGKIVAQIPGDSFTYFTRGSFRKLARMIYQYAYVKGQILAKERRPANLRSSVPAMCLLASPPLLVFPELLAGVAVAYSMLCVTAAANRLRSRFGVKQFLGMIASFPVMHIAHAIGFWSGLLNTLSGRSTASMESTR